MKRRTGPFQAPAVGVMVWLTLWPGFGVLTNSQTGTVKLRMVPAQGSFPGSFRNGVDGRTCLASAAPTEAGGYRRLHRPPVTLSITFTVPEVYGLRMEAEPEPLYASRHRQLGDALRPALPRTFSLPNLAGLATLPAGLFPIADQR